MTSNPKYQKPFMPLIPGVKIGKLNDTPALESLVGEKTCAVIVEPIQGEGGINAADVEWLRALRKRCDEVGAVLIYDEIQVSQCPPAFGFSPSAALLVRKLGRQLHYTYTCERRILTETCCV